MKKLLNLSYFLLVFIIPITVIYFNIDKYLVTMTESSIEYLQSYLIRLANNIASSIEFKKLFIKGLIAYITIRIMNKKIFDRKLGLSLKERKGDWIITIWQITFNITAWIIIFKLATIFKINTDAVVESSNVIMSLVIVGVICKIISTYIYYMENMKKQ